MADKAFDQIQHELDRFKKKYYLNRLLKSSFIFTISFICLYLVISLTEFSLQLDKLPRALLFFVSLAIVLILLGKFVIIPAYYLLFSRKYFSDMQAAVFVGKHYDRIDDKLLNLLQLNESEKADNTLILAGIRQKVQELQPHKFSLAIDLSPEYKRNLIAFLGVIVLIISALWISPSFFLEPTRRVVQYNREFVPPAPFTFYWENEGQRFFKNESAQLEFRVAGESLPDDVYLVSANRRIKLRKSSSSRFAHEIDRLAGDLTFHLEAAGFRSKEFSSKVFEKPNLQFLQIELVYPKYLNRPKERIQNTGNLRFPEGTQAMWSVQTAATDQIYFITPSINDTLSASRNGLFHYKRSFYSNTDYRLMLSNAEGITKDNYQYSIEVIKDAFPELSVELIKDTASLNYVIFGGEIADDYGITRLSLFYYPPGEPQAVKEKRITVDNTRSQSFFYQWYLDSLQLDFGDQLSFYLKVWDNDAINGYKSSKSPTYSLKIPTKNELIENAEKSSQSAENQLNKSITRAREIKKDIEDIQNSLKGKKRLSWEDQQNLNQLLQKKEKLEKDIARLKKEYQKVKDGYQEITPEAKDLMEKSKELQRLMDEILDEETKKLYDELEKLLEEKSSSMDEFQKKMEEIANQESDMSSRLERTLELFKRFKVEAKVESMVEKLEDLSEKQETLKEQTAESKEAKMQDLASDQDKLNKEFEEITEDKKELEQMNQELKSPENLPDTQENEEKISEQLQKAQENLEQNKKSPAQKNQQEAQDNMQQMADKMKQMQGSMSMQGATENMRDLQQILDNLVHLSFDQEEALKEMRQVIPSDPQYTEIGEQQLRIMEDSKIVEDSLRALANRVFQIQTFVMNELSEMSRNMEKGIEYIRQKDRGNSVTRQQMAMTHMNNLANMLSDVLDNMQQSMMGSGKPNGNKGQNMSLSQLQQQLNDQIQQLKRSGKSGRELSEELARLAAEQEQIKQALKQAGLKEMKGGKGERSGKEQGQGKNQLIQEMEKTELDLVNKRLSEKLMDRQEQLLNHLIDYEKSIKERGQDEKREARQAEDYNRMAPPAIEEYLKAKEQEIELLKTIPARLNPYYKNEVNEYFKRLKRQE